MIIQLTINIKELTERTGRLANTTHTCVCFSYLFFVGIVYIYIINLIILFFHIFFIFKPGTWSPRRPCRRCTARWCRGSPRRGTGPSPAPPGSLRYRRPSARPPLSCRRTQRSRRMSCDPFNKDKYKFKSNRSLMANVSINFRLWNYLSFYLANFAYGPLGLLRRSSRAFSISTLSLVNSLSMSSFSSSSLEL